MLEPDGEERVHIEFTDVAQVTRQYHKRSWDNKFVAFDVVTKALERGIWQRSINDFIVKNARAFTLSTPRGTVDPDSLSSSAQGAIRSAIHREYCALVAVVIERIFKTNSMSPDNFMRACEIARYRDRDEEYNQVWEQIGAIDNPVILCRMMVRQTHTRASHATAVGTPAQLAQEVEVEVALQASLYELERFNERKRCESLGESSNVKFALPVQTIMDANDGAEGAAPTITRSASRDTSSSPLRKRRESLDVSSDLKLTALAVQTTMNASNGSEVAAAPATRSASRDSSSSPPLRSTSARSPLNELSIAVDDGEDGTLSESLLRGQVPSVVWSSQAVTDFKSPVSINKYLRNCSRLFTPRGILSTSSREVSKALGRSHSPAIVPPPPVPKSRRFRCLLENTPESEEMEGEAEDEIATPMLDASSTGRGETLAAVCANGWTLRAASEEHKRDREIVLAAVRHTCWALEYASEELKADREIVSIAVRQSGWAIEHAAEELKSDRDIVLAAVQQDWHALEFAAKVLQRDHEIVSAAVRQDWHALDYAAPTLLADRAFMLNTVQRDWRALRCASSDLLRDQGLVFAALEQNGIALHFAAPVLKGDDRFVRALGFAILEGRVTVPDSIYSSHYVRLKWNSAVLMSLGVPLALTDGADIVADLSERGRRGTTTVVRQVRLVLTGPGSAGKTCLLRALATGELIGTPGAEVMTDGVDCGLWSAAAGDERWKQLQPGQSVCTRVTSPRQRSRVRISSFDLAGQAIYNVTHPVFFASPNLVVLLCWNPRAMDAADVRLHDRLQEVAVRAPGAIVIISTTHAESATADSAETAQLVALMQREFEGRLRLLGPHFTVDSKSGLGITALRTFIVATMMDFNRMGHAIATCVPDGFHAFEKDLVALSRSRVEMNEESHSALSLDGVPVCTLAELRGLWRGGSEEFKRALDLLESGGSICPAFDASRNGVVDRDSENSKHLLIFLSVAWLAELLSSVVSAVDVRKKVLSQGLLVHDDATLEALWPVSKVPRHVRPALLQLLHRLEIAYVVPITKFAGGASPWRDSRRSLGVMRSLVPAMLPLQRPDGVGDAFNTSVVAGTSFAASRLAFAFLPDDFFPRLLVRTSRYAAPGQAWRSGAVLQRGRCVALLSIGAANVSATKWGKTLTIDVRGPWPTVLRGIIRDCIYTLASSYHDDGIATPCTSPRASPRASPHSHRKVLVKVKGVVAGESLSPAGSRSASPVEDVSQRTSRSCSQRRGLHVTEEHLLCMHHPVPAPYKMKSALNRIARRRAVCCRCEDDTGDCALSLRECGAALATHDLQSAGLLTGSDLEAHFDRLADAMAASAEESDEEGAEGGGGCGDFLAQAFELRRCALRVAEVATVGGGKRATLLVVPLPRIGCGDAWKQLACDSIELIALCECPDGRTWHACGVVPLSQPRGVLLQNAPTFIRLLRACELAGVEGIDSSRIAQLSAMRALIESEASEAGAEARLGGDALSMLVASAAHKLTAVKVSSMQRPQWMCTHHWEESDAFKAGVVARRLVESESRADRLQAKLRDADADIERMARRAEDADAKAERMARCAAEATAEAQRARAAAEEAEESRRQGDLLVGEARAKFLSEIDAAAQRVLIAEAAASKAVQQSELARKVAAERHASAIRTSVTAQRTLGLADARIADAEQRVATTEAKLRDAERRVADAERVAVEELRVTDSPARDVVRRADTVSAEVRRVRFATTRAKSIAANQSDLDPAASTLDLANVQTVVAERRSVATTEAKPRDTVRLADAERRGADTERRGAARRVDTASAESRRANLKIARTVSIDRVKGQSDLAASKRRGSDDAQYRACAEGKAAAAALKIPKASRASVDPAEHFALPSSWDAQRGAVPVAHGDPEWHRVEALLRESLPTARLTGLDAVRNEHHWRLYAAAKYLMVAKGGLPNEMELWHGTGSTDPAKIYEGERGFDPTYSIDSRGGKSYGIGSYFARHAIYAHWRRAHPSRDGPGSKTLLIANVLVGDTKDYGAACCGANVKNEPEKPDGTL